MVNCVNPSSYKVPWGYKAGCIGAFGVRACLDLEFGWEVKPFLWLVFVQDEKLLNEVLSIILKCKELVLQYSGQVIFFAAS